MFCGSDAAEKRCGLGRVPAGAGAVSRLLVDRQKRLHGGARLGDACAVGDRSSPTRTCFTPAFQRLRYSAFLRP